MPLQKLTSSLNDDSGSTAGQAPASGGLFGSAQQPANASTPKPSLFGTSTANTQQQSQPANSLFGASTTAATPQQAGGLFGAAKPAQPAAQGTPNLFGTTPQAQNQTQPQTQAAGGLFGNANASTTQTTTGLSLFGGAKPAQPANNATGNTMLGAATQPRPSLL